jgi:hypothetical protein
MVGFRELSDGDDREKLEQGAKAPPVLGCRQKNDRD